VSTRAQQLIESVQHGSTVAQVLAEAAAPDTALKLRNRVQRALKSAGIDSGVNRGVGLSNPYSPVQTLTMYARRTAVDAVLGVLKGMGLTMKPGRSSSFTSQVPDSPTWVSSVTATPGGDVVIDVHGPKKVKRSIQPYYD
jgi:hypothetical protein